MSKREYYGLYQGVVTNIKDPEKRGRIKVRCPEVLGGSTESAWCDPLVQVAYDNGGDFCIPAVDELVWLQFIAGDPNKPVYMGGWWQKNMTPLGNNYDSVDKVRIISYADCTITMQDGKIDINIGSGTCDLRIEDNTVTVKGDLKVEGNITANNISSDSVTTSGSVSASSVKSTGQVSASTIKATTGNITTINATNITASEKVEASGVEATDITSTGTSTLKSIEATSVSTTTLAVGGKNYSTHRHSGVTAGSDETGIPN